MAPDSRESGESKVDAARHLRLLNASPVLVPRAAAGKVRLAAEVAGSTGRVTWWLAGERVGYHFPLLPLNDCATALSRFLLAILRFA